MSRTMTTRDGDMVDMIALEVYGRTEGATEALLDANPCLAGQAARLPAGLVVALPDLTEAPIKTTVRLWD